MKTQHQYCTCDRVSEVLEGLSLVPWNPWKNLSVVGVPTTPPVGRRSVVGMPTAPPVGRQSVVGVPTALPVGRWRQEDPCDLLASWTSQTLEFQVQQVILF